MSNGVTDQALTDMIINTAPSFIVFISMRLGTEGCWEWRKSADKDGYGRTKHFGKTAIAHRVSYKILAGEIPNGLFLLHSCDNPSCCNPKHLTPGTQKENYADARNKGRASIGEKNGSSRFTIAQVIAIRADTRRQIDIAKEYGVGQTAISALKTGQNWKHVT